MWKDAVVVAQIHLVGRCDQGAHVVAAAGAGHALAHGQLHGRHDARGRLHPGGALHQVVVRVVVLVLQGVVVDLVQHVGRGQGVTGDGRHGRQSAGLELREDFGEETGL